MDGAHYFSSHFYNLLWYTNEDVEHGSYEGFGLPVLEAQIHGTRVAVANAGALPEVVGDGAVLPVDDPASWAAEMATPDSEPLAAIRARAARAKQQDWPSAARRWLAALRELSSSPA